MRLIALLILLVANIGELNAQETLDQKSQITNSPTQQKWVMYYRNFHNPYIKASVVNFAEKSKKEFGEYNIVPSKDMEQGRAFAELLKGNIDIFVGAPTIEREKLASAIYLPLDRGLLGFRLCLIHKDTSDLSNISSPRQFIDKRLTVGLGSHWPDRYIYEHNGFATTTSPVHEALFPMLANKRFDCLSRSVGEVSAELLTYQHLDIKLEERLVFIYPNSDFIFINAGNPKLHKRLTAGINEALNDDSFLNLFNEYHQNDLRNHNVFQRKLIFLKNDNLSTEALMAINQYGVASFLTNKLPGESNNASD